jgi:2-C-methyl-D-erythritol 2,4-cyclodiphosphate synthase
VAQAVADAVLGAAALGDLGDLFPSNDPRWRDADSMVLLGTVVSRLDRLALHPANVDVTVIAQDVRVAPHRERMRSNLAAVLQIHEDAVSVKATTTDHMGAIGRNEGIAAMAIVSLASRSDT